MHSAVWYSTPGRLSYLGSITEVSWDKFPQTVLEGCCRHKNTADCGQQEEEAMLHREQCRWRLSSTVST